MSDRPKTIHDEAKLRDALKRLIDGVWCGGDRSSRVEVHRSIAPCFSIPANYDRDADLILGVAIDELLRLRAVAEAAEAVKRIADAVQEWKDSPALIALGKALAAVGPNVHTPEEK